jgi:hypothetical protein
LTASENTTSGGNGTLNGDGSFQDCQVTLTLGGSSYAETLKGSESVKNTASSGALQSFTNDVRLTVSGDLGFSVDCDIRYSATGGESFDCVFLDSEGTEITISETDLGNNFVLIADPFDF